MVKKSASVRLVLAVLFVAIFTGHIGKVEACERIDWPIWGSSCQDCSGTRTCYWYYYCSGLCDPGKCCSFDGYSPPDFVLSHQYFMCGVGQFGTCVLYYKGCDYKFVDKCACQ